MAIHAPANLVYEACTHLDLANLTLPRLLFKTRALVMGAKHNESGPATSLIEQMTSIGWVVLEEVPGSEIVMGAAARPWNAAVTFNGIPPSRFEAFDEPGWVKIAWDFTVEPLTRSRSIVTTETRVRATDAESRRRFRRYWALALPGIKLIRYAALRAIKINAEQARIRNEPPEGGSKL